MNTITGIRRIDPSLLKMYRFLSASYSVAVLRNLPFFLKNIFTNNLSIDQAGLKGRGLYTKKAIEKDTLAFIVKGKTHHFEAHTKEDCYLYPDWFAVDKNIWIDPVSPYTFLNHSCEPNLGIRNKREFVALRDIKPGDELTFDYSITEDEIEWTMNCACGEKECRKVIRSIQFLSPEIYQKRLPYVPKYFQKLYEHN